MALVVGAAAWSLITENRASKSRGLIFGTSPKVLTPKYKLRAL
jgi:hypothetical protein